MKKFISFFVGILSLFNVYAQVEGEPQLSVTPIMPEYGDVPVEAQNFLLSKLQRVITANGMVENGGERFVLTPRVDIVESGVTSAGMILLKLDITFLLGDVVEDKIYGSAVVSTTGIGDSETKCYVKAFQTLRPNHPELVKMFASAKESIISYYNDNSESIIGEIDRLVLMGQFDEAMTKAITIPSICGDFHKTCQNKALEVYEAKKAADKQEVDKMGLFLLQQARSAWTARSNYESAEKALEILAQIDPYAECRPQADELLSQINNKLRATEQAQWEFTLKKYEDQLAMDKQKQADKTAVLNALVGRFGRIDIGIQKEKTKRWGFANSK